MLDLNLFKQGVFEMAERMERHKKGHEEKRKEKHKAPKKHASKKEMHCDGREVKKKTIDY